MARDVNEWLEGLGLGKYTEAFAENGVDISLLSELTNQDLKDLGVERLVDRKTILKAIARMADSDDKLAFEPPAPTIIAGERRQVTVLFSDMVGYTKLSSKLGAEDTHALLNRYFEAVDSIIESYGGSVDKHIGDNVMAVFGAPVAHDDDPLRAGAPPAKFTRPWSGFRLTRSSPCKPISGSPVVRLSPAAQAAMRTGSTRSQAMR
jgi:class 3 adenylate cyclase